MTFKYERAFQTFPWNYTKLLDLAENDTVYTHSLMRKGEIDYNDKRVLILGGGDGALMYELRKHFKPALVLMVEVDQCFYEQSHLHKAKQVVF